jgi:pimeloyl-ACP methyl ester carboxylesterase
MERTIQLYTEADTVIEYSIVGKGIPILMFHGGHSNCKEKFGYAELLEQGYCIITPSRAGYGKTSHQIGETLQTACQAYAKLLDHLQLEKVHVIAISAGGPSGIYFASYYPTYVKSLILQSSVTKEWLTKEDKNYKVAKVLFRPSVEKYTWKLVRSFNNMFPHVFFKYMASSFSTFTYAEIREQMDDDEIEEIRQMNNRQRSGHGFMIDLAQTSDISSVDLQRITCPTLILHSKNDCLVHIEHAYHAYSYISDSTLYLLDTWGHLIWLGKQSQQLHEAVVEFLQNN